MSFAKLKNLHTALNELPAKQPVKAATLIAAVYLAVFWLLVMPFKSDTALHPTFGTAICFALGFSCIGVVQFNRTVFKTFILLVMLAMFGHVVIGVILHPTMAGVELNWARASLWLCYGLGVALLRETLNKAKFSNFSLC